MESNHLHRFFDRLWNNVSGWGAQEWNDCPPDQHLARLAKEPIESEQHVNKCDRCSTIIKLLREADQSNSKLKVFIMMTREMDREPVKPRRASIWTYLNAFFWIDRTKWRLIPVASVAALLVFGVMFWGWRDLVHDQNTVLGTVALGEDEYWYAVRLLQARTNELLQPSFIPHDKRQKQIEEITEKVSELYRLPGGLEEDQRGELSDLIAVYQSTVIREAKTGPKGGETGQSGQFPGLIQPSVSQDPETTATLYAAIGQAVTKKNPRAADNPSTQMEHADAIWAGRLEVRVKGIKANEISVFDVKSDRNPAEMDAVNQGINMFESQKPYHVTMVGPITEKGSRVVVPTFSRPAKP